MKVTSWNTETTPVLLGIPHLQCLAHTHNSVWMHCIHSSILCKKNHGYSIALNNCSEKRSWRNTNFFFPTHKRNWLRLDLCLCVLSHFSHVRLFSSLRTVACQAPLSMGFSRQEYWSGLPCPPPEDLPDPGIEPVSLTSPALAGRFFTASATWEAP